MKKILTFVITAITLICFSSYAAEKSSYQAQLKKRMDAFEEKVEAKYKDRDVNDFEYRQYIDELYEEWDKELNSVYQKIINTMNKSQEYNNAKKHLIQAQREWIKFRDSSSSLKYYLISGNMGGTMGLNPSVTEKVNLLRTRTLQLAEIYDFIID